MQGVFTNKIGRRYGSYVVIDEAGRKKNGEVLWLCECQCGNRAKHSTSRLKVLDRCFDCYIDAVRKKRDNKMIGNKFGSKTVIKRVGHNTWLCRCDCGSEREYIDTHFATIAAPHCADCQENGNYKHGMSRTKEYQTRYRRKRTWIKLQGELPKNYCRTLRKLQKGKCACCLDDIPTKGRGVHLDHIVPISAGGKHEPHNVQLLCASCNLRKTNKDPIDWRQEQGFLL